MQISRKERQIAQVRRLIWLYFFLLIFEGALRKWVLPGLSDPLLLVRTPVILWIYFSALRARVIPRNGYIKAMTYLAFFYFLASSLSPWNNIFVTIYGLQANFLHLPLIFLMPMVLSRADVEKIGKWLLILSIMMAVLMVLQFNSGRDSFWNRGLSGGWDQLISALGKGRPPGTFSFSVGPALFFPFVACFVVYAFTQKKLYPLILSSTAAVSLLLAMAVSGSRSLVMGVVVIFLMAGSSILINSRLTGKLNKVISWGVIFGCIVSFFAVFKAGVEVLRVRFEAAGGLVEGILKRVADNFTDAFSVIAYAPLSGQGIGTGTCLGSYLLTGARGKLWVENEWLRCIYEGGLILGVLYILLRIAIVLFLFGKSYKSLSQLNFLPFLLFGACAVNVLLGQFGQATVLGFAVFGAGLCLAAANMDSLPEKGSR